MAKLTLRSRLFLSHLAVMGAGILTLTSIGWLYSPRLFVVSLERIEAYGISVRQVRTQLIQGFEFAWSRGMLWSVLVGGTTAAALSYWLSRRIIRPLDRMEAVTREFAAGHLDQRVPASEIPEIQRLAHSFNRMAADLDHVEQRRRELVGDLTHELRTPLTILQGYLEGLADETVEASPELYGRLAQETGRLQRLVNDLQELSKLEAGYLPIHIQPFDLRSQLEAIVERFRSQIAEDRPLSLSLDCSTALPRVLGDPERTDQVLVNLLSNALRYTEAGQIRVVSYSQGGQVWVRVQDTGVGIADADLPYVFERFWRADRSRDRASGGTGVGLTICRRLVEVQGGQMGVSSQLGIGSDFHFCLPVAPAE